MSTRTFTFLQVADVHLDSKLNSSRISLPLNKRHERSNEIFQALESAFNLARERSADAIFIAGDLWDSENISAHTVNKVIELTAGVDMPVVIAPGNHDYCSKDSFYSNEMLKNRSMRIWPDNVHIFQHPNFEVFTMNENVSVTGRAFSGNVVMAERLLLNPVPKNHDCPINILLFHGSLDGYTGGDASWSGKITAPFSAAELGLLGFTYAAIGHYHDYTEIVSSQGDLLGAYSGCLVGRGLDEAGPRFAVLGTVNLDTAHVNLEKIELDKRRVVKTSCDLTDLTAAEMIEKINRCLQQAGARSPNDIVYLELTGICPIGAQPNNIMDKIDPYYHLAVDDKSRPNYSLEKCDIRTTEGKFIQAILEMKKKVEENSPILSDTASGAELSAETIEDALYYGLDALKQNQVMLRHVD